MKTLGFDLDGVLYDWHTSAYNYVTQYMGVTDSFQKFWTEIDANYSGIWQKNLLSTLHLYGNMVPKSRHLLLLNELAKKWRIIYVTARCEHTLGWVTRNYLKRYEYPNKNELFFADEKRPIIIQEEVDYFVEDRVKHIQELIGFTNPILIKKSYNEIMWDVVPTIRTLDELKEVLP